MCKGFDHNRELQVDTWCGNFHNNKPQQICRITDQSDARHCVKLVSLRPRDMKVHVRGIIEKNKAKFEGDPAVIQSDTEWTYSTTLYAKYGLHEEDLRDVIIKKRLTGGEIVKLEVEYEDHWNPALKRSADSGRLVFKIDVA